MLGEFRPLDSLRGEEIFLNLLFSLLVPILLICRDRFLHFSFKEFADWEEQGSLPSQALPIRGDVIYGLVIDKVRNYLPVKVVSILVAMHPGTDAQEVRGGGET